MTVIRADLSDIKSIRKYDNHIPMQQTEECIKLGLVYLIKTDKDETAGIIRYSLFWQTVPFLDLLYIDENYRGRGFGTKLMNYWEEMLAGQNYRYAMLSTQEDETARFFYEKLGYRKIGSFLPPWQSADELIYIKEI